MLDAPAALQVTESRHEHLCFIAVMQQAEVAL